MNEIYKPDSCDLNSNAATQFTNSGPCLIVKIKDILGHYIPKVFSKYPIMYTFVHEARMCFTHTHPSAIGTSLT